MAESKRVSGRRATVENTAGEGVRVARPSSRRIATADPNSPPGSARMRPASVRTVPGSSPGSSRRGSAGSKRSGSAPPQGGRELMIAVGIISVLALLALILYFQRQSQKSVVEGEWLRIQRIREANLNMAKEAMDKAEQAGLRFVKGEDADANENSLFGSFKSDTRIFNVIFDKHKKDRFGVDQPDYRPMYPDRVRNTYELNFPTKDEDAHRWGLSLKYGLAENMTLPILIATKIIRPTDEIRSSQGGTIIAVIRFEGDDPVFEKAIHSKSAQIEKQAAEAAPGAAAAPAAGATSTAAPESKPAAK